MDLEERRRQVRLEELQMDLDCRRNAVNFIRGELVRALRAIRILHRDHPSGWWWIDLPTEHLTVCVKAAELRAERRAVATAQQRITWLG